MLTDKNDIAAYLISLENQILRGEKRRIELTHKWANLFPPEPGIYIVFEDSALVYVGETGNIRGRLRDLLDSRHHTLRRSIGKINFHKIAGYQDATTRQKFPPHIEEKVNRWLLEKGFVSIMSLSLGRKELEEALIKKYSPKYNKKGERITS